MGAVLLQLEQSLRSQQEKLTPQEANVLLTCRSKAVREFTAGLLVGGSVALAATWKLTKFARVYISGGAAAVIGLWRFNRSLDSCVDHILDLDGSRMQRELANIIVNKHLDDPWTMQRLYRHFYSERVFDDSTSDKPILRWRYRNYFGDNVASSQETHESDLPSDSHVISHNDSDGKRAHIRSNKFPINPDADVMEDPLDSIFGCISPVEEIRHPSHPSTTSRAHNHSRRRFHRRRRVGHHESPDTKHAQLQ